MNKSPGALGSRLRHLRLALLGFVILPALLTLGRWTKTPLGIDAVSAVTPGHVSVVGARPLPATLTATAADSLVRRVLYLSGGVHKGIATDAERILVRPGQPEGALAREHHLLLLSAVLQAIHDAAPRAELMLLVGGHDGGDQTWNDTLQQHLQTKPLAAIGVELLNVATEEVEPIDVPDGGSASGLYDVPIVLLECDAVINVVHGEGAFAVLHNLWDLAHPKASTTSASRWASLVDRALLADVSYTIAAITDAAPGPVLLASRDGIAVERIAFEVTGAAVDSTFEATLQLAHERHLGQVDLADIKVSGIDVAGSWVQAESP